MIPKDPKAVLWRYLDVAHDALLWKLEGLGEYDVRRPLTPTGTNLLGVVKHLAWVELGYFGDVFGRPSGDEPPMGGDEPNADMYARLDETRADILDLFARAREHARATVDDLDLDSEGHVPWWGDANPVTLQLIMVHMIAEVHRHLGQIDILREGLDGSVGLREGADNLPDIDPGYWPEYYEHLERVAAEAQRAALQRAGEG